MKPITDFLNKVHQGNNLDILKEMPSNSIDSIITDPPAGISFMGKHWDDDKGGRDVWIKWLSEVFIESKRVLKPGGHALVWSLPRTSHWTGMALEHAGFEVRDKIFDLISANNIYDDFIYSLTLEQQKMWGLILESISPSAIEHIFGSGFPKSLDISKQLDKHFGVEREVIQERNKGTHKNGNSYQYSQMKNETGNCPITLPQSPEAKQWSGYGTALKPAVECWWLVRKPISEKTVAENVLKWGVGGLNIEMCRVPTTTEEYEKLNDGRQSNRTIRAGEVAKGFGMKPEGLKDTEQSPNGRFPANIIHDGSDEVMAEFAKVGISKSSGGKGEKSMGGMGRSKYGTYALDRLGEHAGGLGDSGTPARFFYCAKPSKSERDNGLIIQIGEDRKTPMAGRGQGGLKCEICGKWKNSGSPCTCPNPKFVEVKFDSKPNLNHHPTVKAQALMEYLIKLITPVNGILLDQFAGSGSTLVAAKKMGYQYIGIEIEPNYCKIAEMRIANTHFEKTISQVTPMARTEVL